jgi:hypothetical protein
MTVDFDVVNRVSELMPESAVKSTQNRVGQSSFDSDTIQNTESSRESVENRTGIDVDLTTLTSPIMSIRLENWIRKRDSHAVQMPASHSTEKE